MRPKAQAMLDYAVLLSIMSLALTGMFVYMKRGVQAVIKVSADEVGTQNKGLIEQDYLPGMVRGSTFINEWDREQTVNRNSDSTQTTEVTKDWSKYEGDSSWEGKGERPFWESQYTKPGEGSDQPDVPTGTGGLR